MKSVLISIKPKWCELIANGDKTVEVRKTRPMIETPFKVYIYCTNAAPYLVYGDRFDGYSFISQYCTTRGYSREEADRIWGVMNGKVIGEFVCDRIGTISYCHGCNFATLGYLFNKINAEDTCLQYHELDKYLDSGKGFGWHISDLVIYDKPRELSDFRKPCDFASDCFMCKRYTPEMYCADIITRPPQSFCYVEELG